MLAFHYVVDFLSERDFLCSLLISMHVIFGICEVDFVSTKVDIEKKIERLKSEDFPQLVLRNKRKLVEEGESMAYLLRYVTLINWY